MAVAGKAAGGCCVGGLTWNPMTTARGGDPMAPMPCYELAWDANGVATHTKRYAMRTHTEITDSEKLYRALGLEDGEQPPEHDKDLITRDEAIRAMRSARVRKVM